MARNISGFHRYKILENNTAGSMAKISTMGPVGMFWDDIFNENPRKIWDMGRGLHCGEAYEAFLDFTNKIKTYEKAITPKSFWAKTEKFVPALPAKIRKRTDSDARAYFRDIYPEDFARSFFTNAVLEMPKDISEEDYFMETFGEDEEQYDF